MSLKEFSQMVNHFVERLPESNTDQFGVTMVTHSVECTGCFRQCSLITSHPLNKRFAKKDILEKDLFSLCKKLVAENPEDSVALDGQLSLISDAREV